MPPRPTPPPLGPIGFAPAPEPARPAEGPGTPVGIHHQPVDGLRPPARPPLDPLGPVVTDAPPRSWTSTPVEVPLVERVGRGPPGIEGSGGIDQVGIVGRATQVLGGQAQAQLAGEDPGPVPHPRRVAGITPVKGLVEHGTAELGVVRPRAQVEVVGPDGRPYVVDDACLGVDVDGFALVVLEVVDGNPVASGPTHEPDGLLVADQLGRFGQRAARSGKRGTTTMSRRSGWRRRASASVSATAADHRYWSSM